MSDLLATGNLTGSFVISILAPRDPEPGRSVMKINEGADRSHLKLR